MAPRLVLQFLGLPQVKLEDKPIATDRRKGMYSLEKSIADTMELGHRNNYLWDRAHLGHLIVRQGKTAEAYEIFFETTREFLKDENITGVYYLLEGMAGLYVAVSRPEVAAHLIGWADAMRETIPDTRLPLEQADVDKIIAACLAKLGEVAFSDAYALEEN